MILDARHHKLGTLGREFNCGHLASSIVRTIFIPRRINLFFFCKYNAISHLHNNRSYGCFKLTIKCRSRLRAPVMDITFVEAAHQPQFPCPKVSRKTG